MKKRFQVLSIVMILMLCAGSFLFAGGAEETAEPVAEEVPMTHDELVTAAQEEGKVVVYSVTSRIANAAEGFKEKYGIEVEATNLKDFELIEKIHPEMKKSRNFGTK